MHCHSTSIDLTPITIAEIGHLYRVLSRSLERIVRADVHASEQVIEDACQFAWSRLVFTGGHVSRERVLGWLAKTAVREAFKLASRDHRELSLEGAIELANDELDRAGPPEPHELIACRERLESIRLLPERQQRLLWLHALGLSYTEMAHYSGCTTRTVERQLLRAKRAIRVTAAA
jgi:RNA polymerase sigma factor (sigma-70 family)